MITKKRRDFENMGNWKNRPRTKIEAQRAQAVSGGALGGVVVAPKPGGMVVAPKPGGMVVAPKLGGMVVAPKLGGMVVAPKPGGMVVAPKLGGMVVAPKLGGMVVAPKLGGLWWVVVPMSALGAVEYWFGIYGADVDEG
jgi:hypothetical protein